MVQDQSTKKDANLDEHHAAHMDGIYKYQRHIYNLTRAYYLLGRNEMIKQLDARPGMSVLEVACGTGRNMVLAAKQYPEAEFYGFDISSEMLLTARPALEKAGFSDRAELTVGDATNFNPAEAGFKDKKFDRVYISYSLSMIPEWEKALAHSISLLKPDGKLLIADFGEQQDLPGWFRKMLYAWLAKFSVHPTENANRRIKEVSDAENMNLHFTKLYKSYAYMAELTPKR